jgi:hypothetical protein
VGVYPGVKVGVGTTGSGVPALPQAARKRRSKKKIIEVLRGTINSRKGLKVLYLNLRAA